MRTANYVESAIKKPVNRTQTTSKIPNTIRNTNRKCAFTRQEFFSALILVDYKEVLTLQIKKELYR